MRSLRFLHMADVHLDKPFSGRGAERRDLLRKSLRDSFERAVSIALEEKLDSFLIAGDLFDRPDPSIDAESFLLGQLRRLDEASIPVFYATGNHDPLGGSRGRPIDWPENVILFQTGRPERRPVVDRSGRTVAHVTGAGHESPAVGENLAARFPAADSSLPEIALLHANVEGSAASGAHERYAPCGTSDLEGKGYDYWALGHIHKREIFGTNPPACYPGSLQGLTRRETGEKGVVVVEVESGMPPSIDFRSTAPVTREEIHVDVGSAGTVAALRERVLSEISGAGRGGPIVLTIFLTGRSALFDELRDREELAAIERGLILDTDLSGLSIRTDRLTRSVEPEKARVGSIETMLDLLEALREGREPFDPVVPEDLANIAAREKDGRADYLLSLLDGMEEEIVHRMWEEES